LSDLANHLQKHFGSTHVMQFELGGGGMSRVFVAEEVSLGRKVVVKVLNPSLAATVSVERFQREIMVVAKLNHANVVPVLSAGEVDGLPYFIMPYVEGESLRGRILRGPLSMRETVGVLKDVTRALAYAHSIGIVHRDIKPDNILLSGSAALVTDFGVAKAVTAARNRGLENKDKEGHSITGIGISLGTPQYMAPEQAAADPNADHRVDLYALGIVAYEMLVGSPPFFGRTPQALLAAQLTELPPPLASRRYDVPLALAEAIMQCLEKDPADRPKNAMDLVRIFESPDALSGPIAATPEAQSRRRIKRATGWLTTALGVGALGALVIWAFWPTGTDAPAARSTFTPVAETLQSTRVRLAPAVGIGSESTPQATALLAAIQAALVRAGMLVFTGPADSTADSTTVLVETTVQRAGSRARANVRVTSPSARVPVWADQLDFSTDAPFAAQDTLAARVVRAVNGARPPLP
jgi:eukaryotic-like serine/threonine-protein kinase